MTVHPVKDVGGQSTVYLGKGESAGVRLLPDEAESLARQLLIVAAQIRDAARAGRGRPDDHHHAADPSRRAPGQDRHPRRAGEEPPWCSVTTTSTWMASVVTYVPNPDTVAAVQNRPNPGQSRSRSSRRTLSVMPRV